MYPLIEEYNQIFKSEFKAVKLNVEINQEIATQYNIRTVPSFLLFKNGVPTYQIIGARSELQFSKEIADKLN